MSRGVCEELGVTTLRSRFGLTRRRTAAAADHITPRPPPRPRPAPMFGLFKKSDPLDAAKKKHAALLAKAAQVSSSQGVVAASVVHAEAAEVEKEIDRLEAERKAG